MDELHRLHKDDVPSASKIQVVAVLDDIRSMHNVGSVFRTADSFAINAVILCGFTPKPPHRDIQKAALGATETVHWQHQEDVASALQQLKSEGYTIIAVEQIHNSISLENYEISPNQKFALVFGNEVEGVSEEALAYCDLAIEIPQGGTKHSLNISVSAGVVLWEFYKVLGLKN